MTVETNHLPDNFNISREQTVPVGVTCIRVWPTLVSFASHNPESVQHNVE